MRHVLPVRNALMLSPWIAALLLVPQCIVPKYEYDPGMDEIPGLTGTGARDGGTAGAAGMTAGAAGMVAGSAGEAGSAGSGAMAGGAGAAGTPGTGGTTGGTAGTGPTGGTAGTGGTPGCGPFECNISGTCYANFAANPGNECQHCDIAFSSTDWTNRQANCQSDSGVCINGSCDTRCSSWADCRAVNGRMMFRVDMHTTLNGNLVCQSYGLTCNSVPVLSPPTAACLAFHPGALVTQSGSGWQQGVYCDATSNELACANTEKCHDCPGCIPGIDCSITSSTLLREYYADCVAP